MTSRRAVVALLIAAAAPLAAEAPAPTGYHWADCEPMAARLLVPDGWHLRSSPGDQADGCSVSAEPPGEDGSFVTGVALSRLRHVPERTGLSPSAFAERFLDELAERYRVRRRSSSRQPPFEAFRAEVEADQPNGGKLRLYQLAIANPATGTVYLIVFRTPAERWKQDWPRVQPLLEQLGLDTGG